MIKTLGEILGRFDNENGHFHNSYSYFLTDGKGVSYGGLPVLDVCIYYVSDMVDVWDTVSTFIHIPRMFMYLDILFTNRLDNIQ